MSWGPVNPATVWGAKVSLVESWKRRQYPAWQLALSSLKAAVIPKNPKKEITRETRIKVAMAKRAIRRTFIPSMKSNWLRMAQAKQTTKKMVRIPATIKAIKMNACISLKVDQTAVEESWAAKVLVSTPPVGLVRRVTPSKDQLILVELMATSVTPPVVEVAEPEEALNSSEKAYQSTMEEAMQTAKITRAAKVARQLSWANLGI